MRFLLVEEDKIKDNYLAESFTLSPEQEEFFKDSKIRNANGELLVCSHNSFSKFDSFDKSKIGDGLTLGRGFYFFDNVPTNIPKQYGENQYLCYLNITNPAILDNPNEFSKILTKLGYSDFEHLLVKNYEIAEVFEEFDIDYEEISTVVSELGYDGIWLKDYHEVIAFEPNQIKSITNTNPTNSNNINESISHQVDIPYDEIPKRFNTVDTPPKGSTLILTDGSFIKLDSQRHDKFIGDFEKIFKVYPNQLNWIWLNDGTYEKDCVYISLPKELPNSSQFNSLYDWLDELHSDTVEIMSRDISGPTKIYDLTIYQPGDIIKKIKRYYSSGKLYENRNEMKESMSIKPGDRVKMDYYAKPNNGATGTCKGRIGQLCSIEWDDGSKSKEITTYLTKIDDIKESINNGYRMDNGMIEDDYFTFERDNITYHFFFKPTRRTNKGQYAILAVDYGIRFDKEPYKDERGHTIIPMSRVHDKPQQLAYFEFNEDTHPEIAYAMTEDDRKEYKDLVVAETKKHMNEGLNEGINNKLTPSQAAQAVKELKLKSNPNINVYIDECMQGVTVTFEGTLEDGKKIILWESNILSTQEQIDTLPSMYRKQSDELDRLREVGYKGIKESNELEQRAKKHKKKSKGMGWHMSMNAGDVEKGIEVFNNSTSLGTSSGEGTAMGEDVENKIYYYDGPIYYRGTKITDTSDIYTTAKSLNVAIRNILYKATKGDKANLYLYDIVDNKVREIPKEETPNVRPKCQTCGYELNDIGDCPVCDYGEDDLLESLSDLEALWTLKNLD